MNEASAVSRLEAERAQLEEFKKQFVGQVTRWLPQWFRRCAYEQARENVRISASLGEEKLRLFRVAVDELAAQSEQIASYFLHDEVWWHVDEGMTRDTVVYSVRLCMGRLRLPLSRYGYIYAQHEWREAERITVYRPSPGGEVDAVKVTEFHPVATGRPFFRCDKQDKEVWSTEHWPEEMSRTLDEYFLVVNRVQNMARQAVKQDEAEEIQRVQAVVRQALDYTLGDEAGTNEDAPDNLVHCAKCRAENYPDSTYCHSCGGRLSVTAKAHG